MNSKVIAHMLALFTVTVWGLTFVSTKVLLVTYSPLQILFTRFLIGLLVLSLLRPRVLKLQERRHELLFMAAGATGVVMYFALENLALVYVDASFASVVVSTAPLFTAILGFVVLKEKGFGPLFVLGFCLAIVGTVFISVQGNAVSESYASPLGLVLCLCAACSWAFYSLLVRKFSMLGYETIASTKRTFMWGVIFAFMLLLIRQEPYDFQALASAENWGNFLLLGAIASAGCFVTWGIVVARLGATMASAYIYLSPAVTVVAGVAVLSEPFTLSIAFGILLVLAGLFLSEAQGRIAEAKQGAGEPVAVVDCNLEA